MSKIRYIVALFLFFSIFSSKLYADTSTKLFINVDSPAAVVIDYKTGRILYDKNASQKRPMASLTKVLTSIMLVENCKMDEMIEVPKNAAWIGGSTVRLKKGDKVSAESLLYGMLLPSGNDCAYTVGEHIGGSIENYGVMATKKAHDIGAMNTSIANPHGLDNENHYSTAYDMALITRYALNNKYINEAVATKSKTVNFGSFSKNLNNTNALLRSYEFADGVKTGFTNGANRCLIASATKDNERYIAVVLGAETTKIRFNDARKLLEESFNRYKIRDISDYLNFYINIPVIKGNIKSYEKKISDNKEIPITDEEYERIYIKQDVMQSITPPMNAGQKIGTIYAYIGDEEIYKKEIILEEDIKSKTPIDYFFEGIKNMFISI